ncbi:MAG: DUF4956 domain-containing protein [Christensenellales bacterium]|jgi:uncharacterized membrane protein YhiD involved in acid resistance|uniref:DUF4956 domain-containing protein n=1 Tax=Candidatus Avichristensenella intestinipullorum TaxID=2840693 RepID=A0A9D1CJJ8_9FIRM|nr:DUF4956 domain-containing protein [Christensenellales bacterium]HIQ62719.1 DUF4956 domain-containing protein [Candidatus Avichristensenella intestinipullorum]
MDNQGTLSAADVIRSSVLDTLAVQMSDMTPLSVVIALLAALLAGIVIAVVYRRAYRGVLYSPSFAITLVMLTLITTPVVMCIGSNIALSMGMVGALSIVRFRTAVKDPMDTAYMYWALTTGIVLGAGLYTIALVVVLGIAIIVLLLTFVKLPSANSYLLVLHYDEAATDAIQSVLSRVKNRRLRSKTVTQNGAEMTVEVRIGERQDIISQMLDIDGVYDATLVACQNEAGA